jgi:hypothetical protein
MKALYAGTFSDVVLIVVLLVTGNTLLAVICFVLLIPAVEYIRRQRSGVKRD